MAKIKNKINTIYQLSVMGFMFLCILFFILSSFNINPLDAISPAHPVLVSKFYSNDNITIIIYDYCKYIEDDFEKIRCVNNFVKNVFNHTSYPRRIESPSKTVEKGGNCMDWTVLYKTVFDKLNIKNSMIDIGTHIFNLAEFDQDRAGYCIIDQSERFCFDYRIDITTALNNTMEYLNKTKGE